MGRVDRTRADALELIRAEQPLWLPKKLARNTAMLFSPDSFAFKKISRGAYRDLPLARVRALLVLTVVAYLLVAVAGVVGIAAARGRRSLPVGIACLVIVLHVITLASPRYRLPIVPLLMVYGSHAVLNLRTLRLSRASRWAVALVLAYFLLWCVPYFRADAAALWSGGTYVEPLRP